MADAKAIPGTLHRCLVSATVLADNADSAAALSALGSMTRIDDILSNGKRQDNRSTAQLKERGRDFELTFVGGRIVGFTATITKRPGNTGYDILKTAYESNAELCVALATGNTATAGTQAFVFTGIITKWDSDEPDPGATTHEMEIKISGISAFVPVQVTVS